MKVDFKGFNEKAVTFECDSTVEKGSLVSMVSNGKVTACKADTNFIGVAQNVSDGFCCVQLNGYTEIKSTGDIAIGFKKLIASDDSSVEVDADNGREHLVVSSINGTIGFIL